MEKVPGKSEQKTEQPGGTWSEPEVFMKQSLLGQLHSSSSVVVVHAWNFREEIIISCQKEKQTSKK